jgi:glutamate synthase (ferredoxin)
MSKLEDYGFIQSKPKGEFHSNNQTMAKLLHKSIGLGAGSAADPAAYQAFMKHFEQSPVAVLRDCLELVSDRSPVPIEEVEPAADIMSRFCTGGMSLGAISREVRGGWGGGLLGKRPSQHRVLRKLEGLRYSVAG